MTRTQTLTNFRHKEINKKAKKIEVIVILIRGGGQILPFEKDRAMR
jgi:hypothetical protein